MKLHSVFFVTSLVLVSGLFGNPLDKYPSRTLFAAALKNFGREVTQTPRTVITALAPYAPDAAKVVGCICFCVCMQKLADASKKK